MLRLILITGAISSIVVGGLAPSQSALACSVGPEFDRFRDASAVVGGRFLGWEPDDGVEFPDYFFDAAEDNLALRNVPIRVHMSVDAVYKGQVPKVITLTDSHSLDIYDHEPKHSWTGASGACGTFREDPTGKYAIMSISDNGDGTYRSFIFGWFYSGNEPSGADYDEAVRYLVERRGSPAELSNRGGTPAQAEPEPEEKSEPWPLFLAGAFVVPLAALIGGAYVQRRGGGH